MRFRLAGLLRARVAQETVAKAAVARSRFAARTAHAEVHRQAASLDAAERMHAGTAQALAGAMAGRHAMAAALSGAVTAARSADGVVAETMADLTLAARQRKAMDKLAEQHARARRRAADAAERAEHDDLINARHARKEGTA
jgi:flagellar export protein FliJ